MHYHNKQPKLVTLTGSFDYEQDFMGEPFDFLYRPSKLKVWLPVVGAAAGAVLTVFPPTSAAGVALTYVSVAAIAAGGVMAVVHETYRERADDTAPPTQQLQYQVIDEGPTVQPEPVKKPVPWGLIAAGVGAVFLMTR